MSIEPSYPQPGSAVGSHWWEASCLGQGATPTTGVLFPSTSAGQEYLVRRLLENYSTSSEEFWQEVQVTLPSTVGGARVLHQCQWQKLLEELLPERPCVVSWRQQLFLLKSALRMALSLSKYSHEAKQVCRSRELHGLRVPHQASGLRQWLKSWVIFSF